MIMQKMALRKDSMALPFYCNKVIICLGWLEWMVLLWVTQYNSGIRGVTGKVTKWVKELCFTLLDTL